MDINVFFLLRIFVCIVLLIQISSDIHLHHLMDMNIFGYQFVSKLIRMSQCHTLVDNNDDTPDKNDSEFHKIHHRHWWWWHGSWSRWSYWYSIRNMKEINIYTVRYTLLKREMLWGEDWGPGLLITQSRKSTKTIKIEAEKLKRAFANSNWTEERAQDWTLGIACCLHNWLKTNWEDTKL